MLTAAVSYSLYLNPRHYLNKPMVSRLDHNTTTQVSIGTYLVGCGLLSKLVAILS